MAGDEHNHDKPDKPSGRTRPMRTPTTAPFGCMWLLYCVPFLAALAAGTAILVFSFVIPNTERNQAVDWVETPCVIENMKLFMHKSRNSRGPAIKNIDAKFRYEFGGRTYTSDRVDFLSRMSFGELEEQSIQFVADHPAGTQMVCYVNPAVPEEAVLLPDRAPGWGALTLGLIFLSVGLVGVIGNYFYLKKRLRTLAHGGYEAGD